MTDEILAILISIPFMIILWEVAVMFGKIIYDDYQEKDHI